MNNWIIFIIIIVVILILFLLFNRTDCNNNLQLKTTQQPDLTEDQKNLISDFERLWINRSVLFREYATALSVRSPGNNFCVKQIRDRLSSNSEALANNLGLILSQKEGSKGLAVIENVNEILENDIKNVENYIVLLKNKQDVTEIKEKIKNERVKLVNEYINNLNLDKDKTSKLFSDLENSIFNEIQAITNNQCMTSLTDFETKTLPNTLKLTRELKSNIQNYILM
jgi:hypothetical protein